MPTMAGTRYLDEFRIAETDHFQKKIKSRMFSSLYGKIRDYVYPILRRNPYFGPNIKKLKGEFEGVYRYRIGNYRLFYLIQGSELIVLILDIEQRKDAY
jgi:mRNA interferase RelE/StbE